MLKQTSLSIGGPLAPRMGNHTLFMRDYRQTLYYKLVNKCYDFTESIMTRWRRGLDLTASQKQSLECISLDNFLAKMRAKADFPMELATYGRNTGIWDHSPPILGQWRFGDLERVNHHSRIRPLRYSANGSRIIQSLALFHSDQGLLAL